MVNGKYTIINNKRSGYILFVNNILDSYQKKENIKEKEFYGQF